MAGNSYSTVVLLILFSSLSLSAGAAGADDKKGLAGSFIFGDSLVDAGNNNYLPTLSKANIRPNGIDFVATNGNPTGRYTNGRTIGDIVGQSSIFPMFMSYIIYLDRYNFS